MTRLSATEVARNFSSVINRVAASEEIEVVRNGEAVVHMRPASGRRTASAARWGELMAAAPAVDEEFAADLDRARKSLGPPPDVEWQS